MPKFPRMTRWSLVTAAMLVALAACQREEGPAEKAGKNVDKAVENVGAQIEKAGDNLQDAAKRDKK